jgi:RNA polymerase sigma-70 factor (ECF subfamily)
MAPSTAEHALGESTYRVHRAAVERAVSRERQRTRNASKGRGQVQRDTRCPTGVSSELELETGGEVREDCVAPVPDFAELFRSYSAFVWRVLVRLGVARVDVDDVAQDVFLSLHRSLASFEGRCSLRSWIYGICQRRALDYRRRAMVRPDSYADEPSDQRVDANQENGLALSQARARMERVLDQLDHEKRSVFVLFDVEGIPMEEVAEIVGCPLQTAYSRLYAARRKIESSLARMRNEWCSS